MLFHCLQILDGILSLGSPWQMPGLRASRCVGNDTGFVLGQKSAGRQLRARTILQELAAIGSRLAECDDFTCPITLQVGQLPAVLWDK